ncbi:hypothetical protein C0J52_01237 [Blattella germanica]|nr:hypothetical protein C0J52_01237 [Blattella germanica]
MKGKSVPVSTDLRFNGSPIFSKTVFTILNQRLNISWLCGTQVKHSPRLGMKILAKSFFKSCHVATIALEEHWIVITH